MATSKLLNGGYTPLDTGIQATTPTSYVEVPNEGARTLGRQVAVTLGLPDTAVKVVPFDATLSDALVVLGQDWTGIGQVPADETPTPSAPSDSSGSPGATPVGTSSKPVHTPKSSKTR
jgi:hypothetical protein